MNSIIEVFLFSIFSDEKNIQLYDRNSEGKGEGKGKKERERQKNGSIM
jgi:hypothetical protein